MSTLYINRSESRCGACNKGCDPYEESHITLVGWFAVSDKMLGCGAVFDSVSSDYRWTEIEKDFKQMRPDLPWIG